MKATSNFTEGESAQFLDEYNIGKIIGQGSYAIVKTGYHKNTKQCFAFKIYDKFKFIDNQKKQSIQNEIMVLKEISHPNIIKLHHTVESTRQICLILEHANGISLQSYAKCKWSGRVDEQEVKIIFKQLLNAIEYCHSKGICHRDIKLENVIIDNKKNVKLIDFGFSMHAKENELMSVYCGTPSYMAPEIILKKPYNGMKADMWSLGVLLYCLIAGVFPFKGAVNKELYSKIIIGKYRIPDCVSQSVVNLISKLLVLDSSKRISAKEALHHQFII